MTTSFIFSYSLLLSLYICRETSTNSPLFMQNKPNLLNIQMNVSIVLTRDYENVHLPGRRKNKPNFKPFASFANRPICVKPTPFSAANCTQIYHFTTNPETAVPGELITGRMNSDPALLCRNVSSGF